MALQMTIESKEGAVVLKNMLQGEDVQIGPTEGHIVIVGTKGLRLYETEEPIAGDVFHFLDYPAHTSAEYTKQELIAPDASNIITVETADTTLKIGKRGKVINLGRGQKIKFTGQPLSPEEMKPDPVHFQVKAEARVLDSDGNIIGSMRAPSQRGALETIALIPGEKPFLPEETLCRLLLGNDNRTVYLEQRGFNKNNPLNWEPRTVDDPPITIPVYEGQILVGYHPFGPTVARIDLHDQQKLEIQAIRW